jgi:methyl-accepting chemotaxis protein
MKFGTKILLLAIIPAALFILGLATSIGSLMLVRSSFDQYIDSEVMVERGLSEMYAQGLQMGQALRNVVLDPANPKALENLKAAQSAYEKAYTQAAQSARDPELQAALQRTVALRAAQAAAQDKVLSLLANGEQAVVALNKEETPAWRTLKAELLKLRDDAAKAAGQVHQGVNQKADFAVMTSLFISLLAFVAMVALNLLTRATMRKELGGDPADARLALEQIAGGDLHAKVHNTGDELSLMGGLQRMQDALRSLVSGVRNSAASIATATDEIAAGSQDLSDRTERQASALEETASSSEQLGTEVQHNAESARQANQLAMEAAAVARQGGTVVGEVVATMKGINDASSKIADIIGVIDGIAFQTNILALNAAVEAARAGEQGRGFAVVASEVRSLAGRSADAAKEIKSLIGASVERVEHGSLLVDRAGQTMSEVVSAIGKVTDIMGAITAASSQQAVDVAQVGEAVSQMDRSTQQNAALVEQMAAAASSLKAQANDMVQAVAVFKLDDAAPRMAGRPAPAPRAAAALSAPHGQVQGINLDNAIKAHADWRTKLRAAGQKHEQVDAQTIGRDDCCELGKWLSGSGQSQCGGVPSFVSLIAAHKGFHQAAGKVAHFINSGHGDEVEKMLGSGSVFATASSDVTRLIVQLRKECEGRSTASKPTVKRAPAAPARLSAPKPVAQVATSNTEGDWETF